MITKTRPLSLLERVLRGEKIDFLFFIVFSYLQAKQSNLERVSKKRVGLIFSFVPFVFLSRQNILVVVVVDVVLIVLSKAKNLWTKCTVDICKTPPKLLSAGSRNHKDYYHDDDDIYDNTYHDYMFLVFCRQLYKSYILSCLHLASLRTISPSSTSMPKVP